MELGVIAERGGNTMADLICRDQHQLVYRQGRFLWAELLGPHQVLSTSAWGGGQRQDLRFLLNHQSCEGSGHHARAVIMHELGHEGYHRQVCAEAGLEPEATAMMGTAANMNYAVAVEEEYAELSVRAVVTAGVEGNAGRAGDPASWHEGEEGWIQADPYAGTINTLLLFNWPLTAAALARAVVTATEAKSAALQELAVASRYSDGMATGTGTDQFCLAAPLDSAKVAKSSSGHHAKLGELIGRAVLRATKEALYWQNGLDPSRTRSLTHALRRFGLDEDGLRQGLESRVDEEARALLVKNLPSVLYDPQVAAASYAFAAVWERQHYGTLPREVAAAVLRQQAALMAACLAARPESWSEFYGDIQLDIDHPLEAVLGALALGWQAKWR
jgi:adenosylcobinamide amidohydrolase